MLVALAFVLSLALDWTDVRPFIDPTGLGQECRAHGPWPDGVEAAARGRPCRQVRAVQHWLNTMMAVPADDPAMATPSRRVRALVGPTLTETDPAFRSGVIETGLARVAALLIASSHPVDLADAPDPTVLAWELPPYYRDLPPLERGVRMRADANLWLRELGLVVLGNVGSPSGDFDFVLIELAHFLYLFGERPDLLEPETVRQLLAMSHRPGAVRLDPVDRKLLGKHSWVFGSLPFLGPFSKATYVFSVTAAASDWVLTETENHVLMSLAYQYLGNQWIAGDRHDTRAWAAMRVPKDVDPSAWLDNRENGVAQAALDVLSRVPIRGFWEQNARSYQGHSYLALLALASHAGDDPVRTAAENALHVLATTFAFQSLHGRRYTPMRRNCERARRLGMYENDAVAQGLGAVTGAYRWNDSPFGYRDVRHRRPEGARRCATRRASDGTPTPCPWREYSWKVDALGDDGEAERIPTDAAQLVDDLPAEGFAERVAFYSAFASYTVPPAVVGFMLDKRSGYWARMMPRFDRLDYRYGRMACSRTIARTAESYDVDRYERLQDWRERVPELYFATNAFINVAGGLYNHDTPGVRETNYRIPYQGSPVDQCDRADGERARTAVYDNLSRPYTVLPAVPLVADPVLETRYAAPFGLGQFFVPEARTRLPLMLGDEERFWKSVNIATYKNVSYGYRVHLYGPAWAGIGYARLAGERPYTVPEHWSRESAFTIGRARFEVYDSPDGYWLVAAEYHESSDVLPWRNRVARGFWEVVPKDGRFPSADAVALEVALRNPPEHFPRAGRRSLRYTTVVGGETLRLSRRYGAVWNNTTIRDAGRVQGITDVEDENLRDVFMRFGNHLAMGQLPLVEVWAVDDAYRFVERADGSRVQYACAREGWLCVHDVEGGRYLFLESRPDEGGPYWEHGTIDPHAEGAWSCACDEDWIPAPPRDPATHHRSPR